MRYAASMSHRTPVSQLVSKRKLAWLHKEPNWFDKFVWWWKERWREGGPDEHRPYPGTRMKAFLDSYTGINQS